MSSSALPFVLPAVAALILACGEAAGPFPNAPPDAGVPPEIARAVTWWDAGVPDAAPPDAGAEPPETLHPLAVATLETPPESLVAVTASGGALLAWVSAAGKASEVSVLRVEATGKAAGEPAPVLSLAASPLALGLTREWRTGVVLLRADTTNGPLVLRLTERGEALGPPEALGPGLGTSAATRLRDGFAVAFVERPGVVALQRLPAQPGAPGPSSTFAAAGVEEVQLAATGEAVMLAWRAGPRWTLRRLDAQAPDVRLPETGPLILLADGEGLVTVSEVGHDGEAPGELRARRRSLDGTPRGPEAHLAKLGSDDFWSATVRPGGLAVITRGPRPLLHRVDEAFEPDAPPLPAPFAMGAVAFRRAGGLWCGAMAATPDGPRHVVACASVAP